MILAADRAIASLDGYVEDEEGRFDWSMPDDELHAFVNDLERPIGTSLCGRRMYETMVFWETASTEANAPAVFSDYAEIWRATEKDRVLPDASRRYPARGRGSSASSIETPSGGSSSPRGPTSQFGGAELAGHAIGAGLVDECHLFLCPNVVGGGKRAVQDNVGAQLELLDERRFRNGVVHLTTA